MAGNLSLNAALRTCKIDVAYANKIQSDRYLNPTQMVCPVWNGYDHTGRPVCADTFMTKTGGCNSAEDRIMVENSVVRPRYFEYITLNPAGMAGDMYGDVNDEVSADIYGNVPRTTRWDMMKAKNDLQNINGYTGNFGLQFGSHIRPGCGGDAYSKAMGYEQTALRNAQMLSTAYDSILNKSASGM